MRLRAVPGRRERDDIRGLTKDLAEDLKRRPHPLLGMMECLEPCTYEGYRYEASAGKVQRYVHVSEPVVAAFPLNFMPGDPRDRPTHRAYAKLLDRAVARARRGGDRLDISAGRQGLRPAPWEREPLLHVEDRTGLVGCDRVETRSSVYGVS
jgi:hypothetical protein